MRKLYSKQTAKDLLYMHPGLEDEFVEFAYDTDDMSDLSLETLTFMANFVMFDNSTTEKVYFQTNTSESEIITTPTYLDVDKRDADLTNLGSTYFDRKLQG